jgi:hypothetical protein
MGCTCTFSQVNQTLQDWWELTRKLPHKEIIRGFDTFFLLIAWLI